MSWLYEQKTGRMVSADDFLLAVGYSGARVGKNAPDMEQIRDVGPIPCGRWVIEVPQDTVTHGPYVLRLTPDASTNTFGRTGFLIHGDSVIEPGTASEGCIILSRFARERIWESGDHILEVVSGIAI